MDYRQFNRNVYSYYIENLIPNEYNTLTIPKSDFEDLIEDVRYIHTFKEVKEYDWSLLLKFDENIPKYFGLLALQCHAVFMMQNDGNVTAANFRDRFITITDISSKQKLNQLFAEKYNDKLNIQEKIWLHAKSFFEQKKILLDLPNPKSHAGRYTQFPESQCVLNYEDLKEYRNFYNHIYTNYETIDYENFISEFKKYRSRLYGQLKRPNNLSSLKENEEKIKRRQIFDFYNSSEWLRFENSSPNKKLINKDFIAKLENDKVVIFDEDFEVFSNYSYLLDKNKLAFFKQDEVYKTEFTKSSKVEKNTFYIIITSSYELSRELLSKKGKEINLNPFSSKFFGVLINLEEELPSCLSNYQNQEFPVKIIGKKISSKRQYLLSNLPHLQSNDGITYALYCNNKRVEGNQPNSSGKYMIKVNGYTSLSFEIIDEVKILDDILEPDVMLNTANLSYSSDGNMSGLGINAVNSEEEDIFSINKWIKSLTNRQVKINKSPNTNFLLKAIKQHKYGKY